MTNTSPSFIEAQALVRPLMVKDLRIEARARGLSPAGSVDDLRGRIIDQIISNKQLSLQGAPGQVSSSALHGSVNNYSRPGGQQNVGNFITDRASSRVLAPPGGKDGVMLGDYQPSPQKAATKGMGSDAAPQRAEPPVESCGTGLVMPSERSHFANNYARPGG